MPLLSVDAPGGNAWRAAQDRTGRPPTRSHPDPDPDPEPEPEPLRLTGPGRPSLAEAIAARRACRQFAPTPLERHQLNAVIAAGHAAHQRFWPSAAHGSLPLRVLVAAYQVASLSPGLYGDPTRPGMDADLLGQPDWLDQLPGRYAAAPVLLLICTDVLAGGAGHAAALQRAGAVGHGMWLAAIGHGLGACAFAGSAGEVTVAVQERESWLRHVFTVAVGQPAN